MTTSTNQPLTTNDYFAWAALGSLLLSLLTLCGVLIPLLGFVSFICSGVLLFCGIVFAAIGLQSKQYKSLAAVSMSISTMLFLGLICLVIYGVFFSH